MVRVDTSLPDTMGNFSMTVINTDFQKRPAYVIVRCGGKIVFEGEVSDENPAHLSVDIDARPAELMKGAR